MKQLYLILSILCYIASIKNSFSQSYFTRSAKEAYFFQIANYPDNNTPNWGNDDWSPNGAANDGNHWFICSVNRDWKGETVSTDYTIWKIPVNIDLNSKLSDYNSVIKFNLQSSSSVEPIFKKFAHAGDIDVCIGPDNKDYIVVPLYSKTSGFTGKAMIAFFRTSDLKFVNYAYLPNQSEAGWCAVSPKDKLLYTSLNNATHLISYKIDWDIILYSPTKHTGLSIVDDYIGIKDEWGTKLHLHNMQGGEFTDSGDLLYLSSGIIECGSGHYQDYQDGIHVLNTLSWQRIQRSTNRQRPPYQKFCFDFDFNNDGCFGQEPEGLTIWNLDDGRAPNIKGQLHVIIDNHNFWTSNKATVYNYKSFNGPNDITVYGTTASGEPASNPQISAFLDQGKTIAGCATISNDAPSVFPPGKTRVIFTVTDNASVRVKDTAYVNVIAKHDECSTALVLNACDKTITDNFCASSSNQIPPITGYSGLIKDVWFKIYPTTNFSIETYQITEGLTNTVMQLFKGTCNNLIEITSNDSSGEGEHAKIIINNFQSSEPLYIRVTDYSGNDYGKFGIYYKKIDNGSNLFVGKQFISGDGNMVNKYPTLASDINGDGKTDLIFPFSSPASGALVIRTKMSNGDGTYTAYEDNFSDGSQVFKYPTLTGDINGDGKTDLIFPFSSPTSGALVIRTKMSNGDGTYTAYEDNFSDGSQVFKYPTLTGDINGDGKTDLIFPFSSPASGALVIRTKMSNGDGTYTAYEDNFSDGSQVFKYPTLTGDINGDGKTDLIFPFSSPTSGALVIRTKMSNGDGTYTAYEDNFSDGSQVFKYPTLTGDINGDGKTDLIFPFSSPTSGALVIRTKMSNGDGTYTAYEDNFSDGSQVFKYPTLTGDINGDGKTDLIFIGQDWAGCGLTIRVKISKGDGTWCNYFQTTGDGSEVQEYPTFTGDINGDSKKDLIFVFNTDTAGLTIRSKISSISEICNFDSTTTNPIVLNNSISIYPNPANNFIRIMGQTSNTYDIQIINLQGLKILSFININTSNKIVLSTIPNGIYFVEIIDEITKNKTVKKLIKIN